jgi:hypothetical protein
MGQSTSQLANLSSPNRIGATVKPMRSGYCCLRLKAS